MAITATTPTEFRNNISSMLISVVEDQNDVILTRGKGGNAVVISEEKWNALNETLYLLSSKANRELLEKGLENIRKHQVKKFSLDEFEQLNGE
jgi:antitoxin YefM